MALSHTDTDIQKVKINKFSTLADFTAAQTGGLIGPDEISFVDEPINVDWNQSDSTKVDYIKNKPTIPDVTGKADKVSNATNGNFAALDSNGNLTDSGHKHSDYAPLSHTHGTITSGGKIQSEAIAPEDGQSLVVIKVSDSTVQKSTITFDTSNTSAFLRKDGTWATPSDGGGSSTLSGLTDTNISSPSAGQTLKYNNSSSKWENSDFPTEIPLQTGNSGKFLTTNGSAVSWANVPSELPTITGNANKILAVNSGATGVEWINNSGGGLTNYDFTHVANTTVSTSTTVTFAANTRGSQMVSTSADLSVTFAINNSSDNYLWIKNTGSSDIDITIYAVTHNSTSVSNVYIPDDGISIPAGKVCEIGIVCNADGAFVTSRSDLSL